MDFFTKMNLKTSNILKFVGLAIVAVIAIVFVFRMVGSSFNAVFEKSGMGETVSQGASSINFALAPELAVKYEADDAIGLSTRNVAVPSGSILPIGNTETTGDTAEEFEVTDYSATIETRRLDKTCAYVADLKARADVIFESSNKYDNSCNYVFKVKRDKVEEILVLIKELDPKELSENIYTIKKLIDDFTSETEILQKKLTSIDETLKKSISAYDDITALAVRVQDVESLTKIINSKLSIIERLTQERININSQLERMQRSKAEQLDRLEYTYFHVNIFENKFIDGEQLKDSWQNAVKNFVRDLNSTIQDITINLVAFLFHALQYAIYFLILLVVIKYGWQLVKHIWKR